MSTLFDFSNMGNASKGILISLIMMYIGWSYLLNKYVITVAVNTLSLS